MKKVLTNTNYRVIIKKKKEADILMRFNNIPTKVIELIELLNSNGFDAYIVGGCVRDLQLGVEPHDWDMCTDAKPNEIIAICKKNNLPYSLQGYEYGTVNINIDRESYEVTTYRAEGNYEDNRHPSEVHFVTNIVDDLSRRDFTINAMAYSPTKDLLVSVDNGEEDLRNGIIRTVGDADSRFNEDALRIVRALRFAIKFGFDIEEETLKAMLSNKDLLDTVSRERITSELEKILTCGKPIKKWFLDAHEIVFKMIPQLEPCYKFNQNNKYHIHDVYEHILYVVDYCQTTDFEIKMSALLHDIGKPATYKVGEDGYGHFLGHPKVSHQLVVDEVFPILRLTRENQKIISELVLHHDEGVVATPKAVRKFISKFGVEFIEKWFILKQADIDDHIYPNGKKAGWMNLDELKETYRLVLEENSALTLRDLALKGNDVIAIKGIKGPEVGRYLELLLNAVMDEEVENTVEGLTAFLQKLD